MQRMHAALLAEVVSTASNSPNLHDAVEGACSRLPAAGAPRVPLAGSAASIGFARRTATFVLAGCSRKLTVVSAIALAAQINVVSAQSLRDAVEAAWARQPIARTQAAREAEFDAKRRAAQAFTPAPPAVGIAHLSDHPTRNEGLREWEAELEIPLWLPGQRARQGAIAEAEREQLHGRLGAAKWRLAGEVRDAYWQVRLAENELALARRKHTEASAILRQAERRLQLGDVSRVDVNQALTAEQAARAAVAESEVKVFRARQGFTTLTGLAAIAPSEEPRPEGAGNLDAHPLLTGIERTAQAARTRLTQATQDTRDNPDLVVGMRRDRASAQVPFDNSVFVRFRFPFSTDARNQPRITAANAELIEAQEELQFERARIQREASSARRELEQLTELAALAAVRLRTAVSSQQLVARGFALGEFDVFTRLRAETERFEAELAATRAELEVSHAVSRLNQALGVLP